MNNVAAPSLLSQKKPWAPCPFFKVALSMADELSQFHREGHAHANLTPEAFVIDPILPKASLARHDLTEGRLASSSLTHSNLPYLSPERILRWNQELDCRSDLYSLGAIFYEMLTGSLPFPTKDELSLFHSQLAQSASYRETEWDRYPKILKAIVQKLMAKDLDERYESANGLAHDLKLCWADFQKGILDHEFLLGTQDFSQHLQISHKLYGREREKAQLLDAMKRVFSTGQTELFLVSGYAGVGKTALIRELYQPVVVQGGFFIAGKFDQVHQATPYLTMAQAFQRLLSEILGGSNEKIAEWRQKLLDALDGQGQLIIDIIPLLEIIIGPQAAEPGVAAIETQSRLLNVLRRFIGVFASAEHPLVMFWDDLQWADAASLSLLEKFSTDPELHHVLFIGCYRRHEVSATHPLALTLGAIRQAHEQIHELVLEPLTSAQLQSFLADTLASKEDNVAELAELLWTKTGGNPFFFIQYLKTLVDERLIELRPGTSQWTWDIAAIARKNYTENVAEFMQEKLQRLHPATQEILKYAACLGNQGDLEDLVALAAEGDSGIKAIEPAVSEGILLVDGRDYRFLHDRVQQAAQALSSPEEQKRIHLKIARWLAEKRAPRDNLIFDVANHYHAARELLADVQERWQAAQWNLSAALKAKASAATVSALDYSRRGVELLPKDAWELNHALTFELLLTRGECEWQCGDADRAETCLTELLNASNLSSLDRLQAYRLLIEVNTTQGKMNQALLLCRQGLALAGIDFTLEPSHDQVMDVYHACRQSLRDHPIESRADLRPVQSPLGKAALDIMLAAIPAALSASSNLGKYLYCVAFHTSLRDGHGDSATWAYTFFAVILGSVFGEYQEAFHLGKLAYDLTQQGEQPWKARVSLVFGNVVNFWTQPMRTNIPYVRTAFQTAQKMGDLVAGCYACIHLVSAMLGVGERLDDVYAETDNGIKFVRPTHYSGFTDILLGQQRLVLTLQGKARQFFEYPADVFDEEGYAARIHASQMPLIKFWYFTWQLQAHYLVGSLDKALAAGDAAAAWLWTSPGHIEEALHKFYHALTLAAVCADRKEAQREDCLQQLRKYRDIFHSWAANCPENFDSMRCLLEAELARLTFQDLEAIRFYEKAIRQAHQNGFIQYEALSYELAANYYEKADLPTFSDHCRREAIRCYRAWGCLGKVQQMEARYPQCRSVGTKESSEPGSLDIDMQSVLRATQSISSEIVPEQLSRTLMRLLVEASGAERGFLILCRNGEQCVEAEAQTSQSGLHVEVLASRPVAEFPGLPQTILKYTERSLEQVLLLDAREPNPFDSDEVLKTRRLKSVLCLPILRHRKLIGMVYLENKLVSHAFSPVKLSTLEILASQAAISIDHARLYADLRAEEEKLRATLEGMADGLMVCGTDEEITLINDAAIHICGFSSRDEVMPGSRVKIANQLDIRDAQGQRLSYDDLPLSRALRGETLIQAEFQIHQVQSGRLKILRVSASPLRRAGDTIQGAVLVLRDVTELMELDLLKGEFLKAMAHELKTPLAVLSGYFELFRVLRDKEGDQARLDTCVQRMEAGLHNLKSLVAALVDISVFQIGKLKLNPSNFDMRALCLELIQEVGSRSARHQLLMPLDEGLPVIIRADRLRIQQVLNNLLDNAIKFSPAGGCVEILLQDEANEIVVKVKDQGIGIPLDRQKRVFQWFYRAHAESEHDYGGMGVGLFMAEEIVQAHRGRIWFDSEPGCGSTFAFCLPRHQK